MAIGVYPGSFDPMTNGHLEVLKRALGIFDEVVLLLAVNPDKKAHFSVEERLAMMKEATKGLKGVKVDFTPGLTVDYCHKVNSRHIIRGLRAVTDFEYEFQLAASNEFADSSVDMVFFMARQKDTFISSSGVISLFKSGVDVSPLVPPVVNEFLKKKGR